MFTKPFFNWVPQSQAIAIIQTISQDIKSTDGASHREASLMKIVQRKIFHVQCKSRKGANCMDFESLTQGLSPTQ